MKWGTPLQSCNDAAPSLNVEAKRCNDGAKSFNDEALSLNDGAKRCRGGASRKFINYILPIGLYVSEIPMNPVAGGHYEHYLPGAYDKNLYKIIFTRAELRNNSGTDGKDILLSTIKRVPVLEVLIDLSQNQVAEIKDSATIVMYENIPVSFY